MQNVNEDNEISETRGISFSAEEFDIGVDRAATSNSTIDVANINSTVICVSNPTPQKCNGFDLELYDDETSL
ncbi:TPA: hypothetical protein N0F65_000950 [Lagenidium giganteum]|uniref:Uncharacterized protein n=1 Tax=Lagenidium giganteum TaxID=4803 RepID=A0AAV2YI71_9STRA|nr:TPA: hypothetical protein N0F65_000950 [Lagenidium giganteum]